jgi:peptidoglycan-associated lipoprotein
MIPKTYAAVLVAAVLAANACGGGDEPAEETPPPAQAQPDSAAQAEAAQAQAAEEARQRDVMAVMINFDFNRTNIRTDARPILDRKIEVLRANTAYRIRIEGHCDARGTEAYNMGLGTRRANAVRQYLVDQGIAASRIEAVSRGETQPLDRGTTREAFARNRRAEFHITAGAGTTN